MPALQWPDKDPADELDYTLDWSDLDAIQEGDSISTVAWTLPAGEGAITEGGGGHSNTDTTSTIWLQGGTAPGVYSIGCEITTANGRTFQRRVTILVKDL
jgi:hypothetical protein